MRRRVTAHLTYANVLSTLALFSVLGGGAYAAATLPENSVGTRQIEAGGVTKSDLARDSVGPAELKDDAVHSGDVEDGSLKCKDFRPQANACGRGPAGPAGADGTDAAVGDAGLTRTVVRSHVESIDMTCTEPSDGPFGYSRSCDGTETVRAECDPGEMVTGGSTSGDDSHSSSADGNNQFVVMTVERDRPDPADGTPTGWAADVTVSGTSSTLNSSITPAIPPQQEITVYAVCAS
jgi:hypothetical protein